MTVQFRLPDLGEGITEAEVVRWLVKPGDTVVQDQEVVEVQTDKAVVELPTPVAGTVLELNATEGQVIPVKSVLLTINEVGQVSETISSMPVVSASAHDASSPAYNSAVAHGAASSPEMTKPGTTDQGREYRRTLATPVARRMARELGIDISMIVGSGPSGRVRTEDVQKFVTRSKQEQDMTVNGVPAKNGYVTSPAAANGAGYVAPSSPLRSGGYVTPSGEADLAHEEERTPLQGLRRRIAENMVLSTSTIPQVTSMIEVDATNLINLRNSVLPSAEQQGIKLSYLPFIIKAVVHALHLYPAVNAAIDDQRKEIVYKRAYHIGMATATPDGLLVPVLRHADRLTLLEIAAEVQRLAEAGRERKLPLEELRGSTFTITNYGSVGGFFTTPIINPGEAAILGLGRIVKRPWVVDDHLEVRSILPLSFTADHRLIDGELAMRFLNTLIATLENPQLLLLHMR